MAGTLVEAPPPLATRKARAPRSVSCREPDQLDWDWHAPFRSLARRAKSCYQPPDGLVRARGIARRRLDSVQSGQVGRSGRPCSQTAESGRAPEDLVAEPSVTSHSRIPTEPLPRAPNFFPRLAPHLPPNWTKSRPTSPPGHSTAAKSARARHFAGSAARGIRRTRPRLQPQRRPLRLSWSKIAAEPLRQRSAPVEEASWRQPRAELVSRPALAVLAAPASSLAPVVSPPPRAAPSRASRTS